MFRKAIKRFNKSELLRGGVLAFVVKIFGLICAYVFTFIITRYYGPEAWGIFSLALAILTVSSILGKFGTDIASMRLVSKFVMSGDMQQMKPLYLNVLFIVCFFSLAVSAILYFLSPVLALDVFENEKLISAIQYFSFGILPMSLIAVNAQNFRGLKQIGLFSFFSNAARNLFSLVVISSLLVCGCIGFLDSYMISIVAYLVGLYIAAIISTFLWVKRLRSVEGVSATFFSFKQLISYSLPQIPTTTMVFVNGWLDGIMLGIYNSEATVGIYNVALKVATLLQIPGLAMNAISGAQISRAFYENDFKKIQAISIKTTKVIFYTVFPAFIVVTLFSSSILRIFGDEFEQAQVALILLAGGFFISSYIGPVGQILTMSGKQKYINIVQLITITANVLLNVWLIPEFGFIGAAIAATFSKVMLNLGNMFLVIYFYKIRTFYIPFLG